MIAERHRFFCSFLSTGQPASQQAHEQGCSAQQGSIPMFNNYINIIIIII